MLRKLLTPSAILRCANIGRKDILNKSLFVTFSSLDRPVTVPISEKDEWIIHSPYRDVIIPEKVSLHEYLFDLQEQNADKVAMVNGETGQEMTHSELRNLSFSFASALARLGYSKGDVFGFISPNCPEFVVAFLALNILGAVSSTINFTFTAEEIKFQLLNAECVAVICHQDKLLDIREACQPNANIRHIISIGPGQDGVLSMQKLLKQEEKSKGLANNPVHINQEDDLVVIPYSSGTTGLPKGVMLTHRNLIANTLQTTSDDVCHLKFGDFADGSRQHIQIGVLPLYHIYGMSTNMLQAIALGSQVITMKEFNKHTFVNLLKKYKPTMLPLVPPLVQFLESSELVSPKLLDTVEFVACGAAPLGHALLERFFKKFGKKIRFAEGYGMTELSPVTHISPVNDFVVGACGMPIPNTSAKLIDPETGMTVGPDVREGELCVRGPQVMKGYFKNDKATRDTIKDGWLHTGDIARIDVAGQTYIIDRLKELIKVKGLQVAPAELENLLRNHPAVDDVAVIGVPDERSGELPRAYVVPKENERVTEEELKQFVVQRVSSHKHLEKVVFLDEIPKSAAGKILRKDLRKML